MVALFLPVGRVPAAARTPASAGTAVRSVNAGAGSARIVPLSKNRTATLVARALSKSWDKPLGRPSALLAGRGRVKPRLGLPDTCLLSGVAGKRATATATRQW